jgi:hypothetical protein
MDSIRDSSYGKTSRRVLLKQSADFKAVLDAVVQITEPETEVPAPENSCWPYTDFSWGRMERCLPNS